MAISELELVNNVDLRLALTESEAQLEMSLNQLLPPLLLKLSSNDPQVRQAVFKVIQNIFPRITAAPNLQLPVKALLHQSQVPNVALGLDSGAVRLYSLLFLSKGVERLSPEAQCKLVPEVICGISSLPVASAARMFSVLVKLLEHWKAPSRDSAEYDKMASTLGFDKNPNDEKFLADKIGKFLLLISNPTPAPISSPGMSISDSAFFTKDSGISYSDSSILNAHKTRLLEFIKAGFSDKNLIFPLLIASVDSLSTIADAAETRFRKLTLDVHDRSLIIALTGLFLGTNAPPAKPALQEKILVYLLKVLPENLTFKATEIAEVGLNSEYSRLRQTTVAFIKKTSKSLFNSKDEQELHCSRVASKLKLNIFADGWPQLDSAKVSDFHKSMKQRELQYETLGDLLGNSVVFLENNIDYVHFLFESLEFEAPELRSVLQTVLSRLTVCLSKLSMEFKEAIRPMLRSIILKTDTNSVCKLLALKYVNMAFEFKDVDARFLCILGATLSPNSEIIEEANRGLDPYQFSMIQNNFTDYSSTSSLNHDCQVNMPSFDDFIIKLKSELANAQGLTLCVINSSLDEAILFAFRVLIIQAVDSHTTIIAQDEHWKTRLSEAVESDEKVRSLVAAEIARLSQIDFQMQNDNAPKNQLQSLVELSFTSLHREFFEGQNIAPNPVLTSVFYTLLKFSPDCIIASLVGHLPQILDVLVACLKFEDSTKRLAKCFGIIGTHQGVSLTYIIDVGSALKRTGGSLSQTEIYLYTISVMLSRLAHRNRLSDLDYQAVFTFLKEVEQSLKTPQLYDAGLDCISELSIYGVIGPSICKSTDLLALVSTFYELIQPRAKACHEPSLLALSKLVLSRDEIYDAGPELLPVETLVFETHSAKNIEFAFVGGECLLIFAGGWQSKYLHQNLDIQGEQLKLVPLESRRFPIILAEVLRSTRVAKPSLRRASCIWLLALVQHLQHTPSIKKKAAEIHAAFMSFLADREEIIQECASRGLGITYDLGDVELKETLVKGLVKSFTETNSSTSIPSGSVDGETQLFDNNVMRTHDGSVSTYKDVLNLASDVGDPSLVYKFMSLAKANASWTTRRGVAFGLGKVLSKSSLDTLLAHDPKLILRLVPKLYRYRFDPNKLVSQSMNEIWNVLFPDSTRVIKANFNNILSEVLNGMGNREWRVRQASILALESFLQSQPYDSYEDNLEDIWSMTFRCMDDIKDTVRKEGQTLAKTLARMLIRSVDVKSGNASVAKATKTITEVIPFFLGNKGLLSDADEVKNFALETVLKLCDNGGDSIKPFIPKLIAIFVELMSSLEPELVNYLVLNAEKYNLTGNEVDMKRIQNLSASPLLEAIDKLIGHIDEDSIGELVSRLTVTIRKSVGLPSKTCGSRVVALLVTKMPSLSKPYADVLLKTCIINLRDRNLAISTSYAMSAGYTCRLASVDSVVAYSMELSQLYFSNKDTKSRLIAAQGLSSVSKFSGFDKFDTVSSAFLPLAFIGKHDPDSEVSALFDAEWVEHGSGSSAIILYFQEIHLLCKEQIKGNDYMIRRIIANSLLEMTSSMDNLPDKHTQQFLQLLLYGCKEKSWVGKELVFDALVNFSVKKAAVLRGDKALFQEVLTTVRVEVNRRNKAYQFHAVQSEGKFIHSFYDVLESISQYIETMSQVLNDDYLEEIDLIDEGRKTEKSLKSQFAVKTEEVYLSLIRNIGDSISSEVYNKELFEFLLKSMKAFLKSGHEYSWRTVVAFNEIIRSLLEPLLELDISSDVLDVVKDLCDVLFGLGDEFKLERNLTLLARNAGLAMKIFHKHNGVDYREAIRKHLLSLAGDKQSSIVLAEIEKALNQFNS